MDRSWSRFSDRITCNSFIENDHRYSLKKYFKKGN